MNGQMEREKQIIEEMAEHIYEYVSKQDSAIVLNYEFGGKHKQGIATELYNAGYRKVDTGVTIHMNGESELTKAFNEEFAIAPQFGWISVEDRLPQENEKVLAINSDGEIFIATYLVHKISPSARGYTTWASGLWNGKPTHWQPLPQPPKMKGAE